MERVKKKLLLFSGMLRLVNSFPEDDGIRTL
jgi:hypothetical protein